MSDRIRLMRDIGVNAGLPYATYLLLTYEGVPTVQALAAGAVFPVGAIIVGFVRERRVQTLGLIVLVATVASILAALYFTSPFLALAKGSLFTRCSACRCWHRCSRAARWCSTSPIGADPDDRQHAETLWETEPRYRRLMRRITVVWSIAFSSRAACAWP